MIDRLTLCYAGNQLKGVTDGAGVVTPAGSTDFGDYADAVREYRFNKNGAMTQDLNKGISEIRYNCLRLPAVVDLKCAEGESRNEYVYSADGVKRWVIRRWDSNYSATPVIGSAVNVSALDRTVTTDYVGNKVYENGSLKQILVEGGYYDLAAGRYYYYLTDHLGNNRVVVEPNGTVVQQTHYDPYGLSLAVGSGAEVQPYKYNGKELDSERGLNWYDYDARCLDPVLGRFTTIDPMAESYYSWGPYVYCGNNPLKYIDPTGMIWDNRKDIEQLKKNIERASSYMRKKVEKNDERITSGDLSDKKADQLKKDNQEFRDRMGYLDQSMNDIAKLGADQKHVYAFWQKSGGEDSVRKGEDGKVYIETSSGAISIHEITHVRQSLDAGGLSFGSDSQLKNAGIGYKGKSDMEVEAYRIQYSLNKSFPGIAKSLNGINYESVADIIFDPPVIDVIAGNYYELDNS